MKRTIGLVLAASVGDSGFCVIVRERGHYDFIKRKAEFWPGLCQLIVNGEIGEGENDRDALTRLMTEQLGGEFTFCFNHFHAKNATLREMIRKVLNIQGCEKDATFYAAIVKAEMLGGIRLGAESGAIRIVPENELGLIIDLNRLFIAKETGVIRRDMTVMFPDDIWAIKESFKGCWES